MRQKLFLRERKKVGRKKERESFDSEGGEEGPKEKDSRSNLS